MEFKTAKPWILTTVKLSPEFYNLAKSKNISITEAVRVGVSLMLAERGEMEYDNNLNFMRKIEKMRVQLEETSNELNKLKDLNGSQKV